MTSEPQNYRRARVRAQFDQRRSLRFERNENRADVSRRLHDLIGTLIREQPEGRSLATTESSLVVALKSSRNSVREALQRLRTEGRMERTRGVGSLSTGLQHFGWIDTLNDGEDPRTEHRLLHLAILANPPEPLVERFELIDHEELVLLERLSFIGDQVRAIRTVYLRVSDRASIDDGFQGDFYDILTRLGIDALEADLYVSAETADDRVAELLGIASGAPLLVFENHTFDSRGRLVYLSYGRSRADLVGLILRKERRTA